VLHLGRTNGLRGCTSEHKGCTSAPLRCAHSLLACPMIHGPPRSAPLPSWAAPMPPRNALRYSPSQGSKRKRPARMGRTCTEIGGAVMAGLPSCPCPSPPPAAAPARPAPRGACCGGVEVEEDGDADDDPRQHAQHAPTMYPTPRVGAGGAALHAGTRQSRGWQGLGFRVQGEPASGSAALHAGTRQSTGGGTEPASVLGLVPARRLLSHSPFYILLWGGRMSSRLPPAVQGSSQALKLCGPGLRPELRLTNCALCTSVSTGAYSS